MVVDGSTLYVAGHAHLQVHDTVTWDTYRIPVPGEQNTLTVVDGLVYAALYPSTNLVKIDPKARTVQVCGAIAAGQQRPWDAKCHAPTGQIVIASGPGTGKLVGALTLWNIHTSEIVRFPNILPDQMVMSVWLKGIITCDRYSWTAENDTISMSLPRPTKRTRINKLPGQRAGNRESETP